MLVKIKNNKVLSNVSWILFGRMFYMALNFIVGLFSARFLGPSNYGLIGYAAAYTTFFSSICNLGINSVIIKELIDRPNKTGEIIGTSIGCKMISCIFSLIAITALCFIIDYEEPLTKLVVFLYNISIIFQIFDTIKYWFQSKLESKYVEITTTIAYIAMSLYKILLLLTKKGVTWFAIANSIEFFLIALILYYLYRKKGGEELKFSKKYAKKLIEKSKHFIISGLMVAIYNATDKFMLKQMISDSEVAYYTTAITLANLSPILLNAIIDSLTPGILKAYKNSQEEFNKKNIRLYSIIFYTSLVVSIMTCIFSKLIIKILYGNDYLDSISVLNILTWYTMFSYLGVARNPWIISLEKQNKLKYIYILCAILNIVLNYFMIPHYGANGAALASLITQFSTIFIFPLFIKDLRENVVMMIEGIFYMIKYCKQKEKDDEQRKYI